MTKPNKPLGRKAYGSIPHLPGSRMGPSDHHCHPGQDAICQTRARDKHDRVIVTEKLDGSNVAIANIDGSIIALGRAGYPAITSKFAQHHHFDTWVSRTKGLWAAMLKPGDMIHGEWLCQAHGTRYRLERDPFVAFDVTHNGVRKPHDEAFGICAFYAVRTPYIISDGAPITIDDAMGSLGEFGKHGAIDPVEGAVWRVERKGVFDFMAKFVKHDKSDGKYLPEMSGKEPVYMWLPE